MEEKRTIKIFKTFEEQEMYFLDTSLRLTPSEEVAGIIKTAEAK